MITYLEGDATQPVGSGKKIIAHIVNNDGAWGAGFVIALQKRFGHSPRLEYQRWAKIKNLAGVDKFELGSVQYIKLAANLYLANMVAQTLYETEPNDIPLKYDALDICLTKLNDIATKESYSVHAPRFGAGLAGGSWKKIESLINKNLTSVPVYIYDYVGEDSVQWNK